MTLFFAFVLIKIENLELALLFILFAGFLPNLAIGNLDGKNLFAFPLLFIIISFVFKIGANYFIGILSSIIYYSTLFFLSNKFNESIPEKITEILLPLTLNIIYFISFFNPINTIIGRIIL
ncbi:MAG: hypothetical protein QXE31_06375 [Candidatus Woesearchaeota archaeon]